MPPVRVFLCDDSVAFRDLMRASLAVDPSIEVVGEAGDGLSGVEGAVATGADVVLLDLAMPRLDGLGALHRLRERLPGCGVVVISGFAADRMADTLLGHGADGYLEKGTQMRDVIAAVHSAAQRTASPAG